MRSYLKIDLFFDQVFRSLWEEYENFGGCQILAIAIADEGKAIEHGVGGDILLTLRRDFKKRVVGRSLGGDLEPAENCKFFAIIDWAEILCYGDVVIGKKEFLLVE